MNNLEEMPKIQDFILEINNISNKPNKVEYSLVLENSCDFIISRKTSRTEKIMAIIISQNLYYIKDNNTGEIINLTYDNAKNFFKEMGENIIVLNEVKWIKEINKNSYDKIMQIISDWIYVEMCKNNIFFYKRDMSDYRRYVQADIKFLKYIFSSIPDIDNTYKYTLSFIDFAYLVKEMFRNKGA